MTHRTPSTAPSPAEAPSVVAAVTLALAIAAAAFLVCSAPDQGATPSAVVALSIAQERT